MAHLRSTPESSWAGKRVLVTGGTGFLGSHLVEHLLQQGATVASLSRKPGTLAAGARGYACIFLRCDLTDQAQARQVISSFEPQVLYHLAAQPDRKESHPQAEMAIRTNLLATLHVLEAFRQCGGQTLIYGDSCKVYGDCDVPYHSSQPLKPVSSYAIAKSAGWQMCELYGREFGLSSIAIRPTLIYGPRQAFNLIAFVVRCVLEGKQEVRLDGGNQTRDPLYVDDAMEAFLAAGASGHRLAGAVINIGGGNELRVVDLAHEVLAVLGSRIPVVADSSRTRSTETRRSYCDNTEASKLLGWQPTTSLRAGLERTISSLLEESGHVWAAGQACPAGASGGPK